MMQQESTKRGQKRQKCQNVSILKTTDTEAVCTIAAVHGGTAVFEVHVATDGAIDCTGPIEGEAACAVD